MQIISKVATTITTDPGKIEVDEHGQRQRMGRTLVPIVRGEKEHKGVDHSDPFVAIQLHALKDAGQISFPADVCCGDHIAKMSGVVAADDKAPGDDDKRKVRRASLKIIKKIAPQPEQDDTDTYSDTRTRTRTPTRR